MEKCADRVRFLLDVRNPDGGWGYFPGKRSWVEPTVYAALALHVDPNDSDSVRRAWGLIRAWQNTDGGWRPNQSVADSTWVTALAVILGLLAGTDQDAVQAGVRWLVGSYGAESSRFARLLHSFRLGGAEREVKYKGWPWRPDTSAWVEPTSHALAALRRALQSDDNRDARKRIDSGERMLLGLRCSDGGWNYGSPKALGVDLPSYPETTGIALHGLGRRAPPDALEHARGCMGSGSSPLARAWLNIGLQAAGSEPVGSPGPFESDDVLLAALEHLSTPGGNWRLLTAGAAA